uniref:Glutathione peroxidase n=2 Tax=Oncorhynchus TaxID=8016 RepID=A0AAZ3PI41_ONCTS
MRTSHSRRSLTEICRCILERANRISLARAWLCPTILACSMFYDLTAKLLTGELFNFSSLQGTTTRDYTQMNELHERYADKGLVILGVPCNQFGHQENCKNEEILMSLKYVRPGNGFEPKFQLLEKVDVNGKDAHPLFVYLKEKLPFPSDEPMALMNDPKCIIWSPVCRTDIAWNFEKFLIGPAGEPFKRYGRRFLTSNIEGDIKELLNTAN